MSSIEEELTAIRKRVRAASSGPWIVTSVPNGPIQLSTPLPADAPPNAINLAVVTVTHHTAWGTVRDAPATAEFIAHAREDIRLLLAEVKRLHTNSNEE